MSEPPRIQSKTESISFRSVYGNSDRRTAVVRRNRTETETRAQFDRIYDMLMANPNMSRFARFSDTYKRTMQALDATGRSIPGQDNHRGTVLVSRRNNRG